jgi:FkbM family methyltransferase
MMELLKKWVKRGFAILGLRVSRLHGSSPFLVYHRADLLLDVGANIGQYAQERRAEGFEGDIVSFEPLPDAHKRLSAVASGDSRWSVHPRAAVGATPGRTEINVAGNSYSSSLLPMLQSHSAAAPQSVFVGKVETDIITLDSVFERYYRPGKRVFLKIDTQGFERPVLEGAGRWLDHLFGVQLELSCVLLYEGQELYPYFLQFFRDRGFELWALIPGFTDPVSGRMLQFDAVFVRNS